jgi:hypothetical protein
MDARKHSHPFDDPKPVRIHKSGSVVVSKYVSRIRFANVFFVVDVFIRGLASTLLFFLGSSCTPYQFGQPQKLQYGDNQNAATIPAVISNTHGGDTFRFSSKQNGKIESLELEGALITIV